MTALQPLLAGWKGQAIAGFLNGFEPLPRKETGTTHQTHGTTRQDVVQLRIVAEMHVQGVSTRKLRTTNMLERVNKEIERRIRVAALFSHETSLLRLVSAVLIEIREEWETGKADLILEASSPTL